MLPNQQARSPFVLKHTTSLFVYMFGRTYVIKRARGKLFFSKKQGFLGLNPVYSETTALSKPYFILKDPKCEKISAKTLAFQETKSFDRLLWH